MKNTGVAAVITLIMAVFASACSQKGTGITMSSLNMPGTVHGSIHEGHPSLNCGTIPFPGMTITPVIQPTPTLGPSLPGITLNLLNADKTVVATTVTASDGTFTFTDVAAGDNYMIEYRYPGYDEVRCYVGRVDASVIAEVHDSAGYFYAPCILYVAFESHISTYQQALGILALYGCTEQVDTSAAFGTSGQMIIRFPPDKTIQEMKEILAADTGISAAAESIYLCPN